MEIEGQPEAPAAPAGAWRSRLRLSLKDLALWVVAAAILASVLRGIRSPWQPHLPASGYEYRILSVIMATLAVVLGVRLVRQAARLVRSPAPGLAGAAGGLVWRVVALAALGGYLAEQARQVGRDVDRDSLPLWAAHSAHVQLPSLCGLLLVAGLVMGLGISRAPAPRRRPRLASAHWWPSALAAALGVALAVGFMASYMVIAHLIMVALEAVGNAIRLHPTERQGLAFRIGWAGLTAAVALVAGILSAGWVGRDLRAAAARAAEGREAGAEAFGPGGLAFRIITLAVTVAASVYVLIVSIPWIHAWLAEGIWMTVGPIQAGLIVMGLAGLCAGIVARALGREPGEPARPSPWRGLLQMAVALPVLVAGFGAFGIICRELAIYPSMPDLVGDMMSAVLKLWDQVWWTVPPLAPFWATLVLWTTWEVLRLCGPQATDRTAALDLALATPARARRFLAYWLAVTALAVCGLPTLFVAGVAAYQVRLLGLEWLGYQP